MYRVVLTQSHRPADHRNVPTAPIKMIYLGDTDGTGGRVAMNEFFLEIKNEGVNMYRVVLTGAAQR